MKRTEREMSNGPVASHTDIRELGVRDVDTIEAEVARARRSFEEGLREASRAGTRAARRVVTPALVGVGLAGGALLLLALARLARRSTREGALIRIVIETPRAPRRLLPAFGGALARWVFERQLRGNGALEALTTALSAGRPARDEGRGLQSSRSLGRYGS